MDTGQVAQRHRPRDGARNRLKGFCGAISGLRYYNPSTGRWLNRDPIEEIGTADVSLSAFVLEERQKRSRTQILNLLYAFLNNSPINAIDVLGLEVLLETHEVGANMNHAKLILILECGSRYWMDLRFLNRTSDGRYYATIGAGPTRIPPLFGYLASGVNRPTDVDRSSTTYSQEMFTSMSNDDLIWELLASEQAYGNGLDYELFPGQNTDGYNSNGFIHGILNSVGVPASAPPNTPGWEKPVPNAEYE